MNLSPRLQHRVTGLDLATIFREFGAIERMGDGANESGCAFSRQNGVCIKRNHITHAGQKREITLPDSVGSVLSATQKAVKLV